VARGSIDARLRSARLVPCHAGVYKTGHVPLTAKGRWMAGVLAAGPEAYLSHGSAAALFGLERPLAVTHVLKRGGKSRHIEPLDGYGAVVVHDCRRLDAHEVTNRMGIPATSFCRTMIDLAGERSREEIEDRLATADRRNLLSLKELESEIDRSRGRKGTGMLREILQGWHPATDDEMLVFENEFSAALAAKGAPRAQINPLLDIHLIDLLFPEFRVMFELDGHSFHRDPATQTKDARRDRKHTLMGYQVNRFTRSEFNRNRDEVIEEALDLLRSRGWKG